MKLKDLKPNSKGYLVIKEKDIQPQYCVNKEFMFYFGDEERMFFKQENRETIVENELLACQIAKHLGLNAVEYYPAIFIDAIGLKHKGVISRDFTQQRKCTRIRAYDFSKCVKTGKMRNTVENQLKQLEEYLTLVQPNLDKPINFNKYTIKKELQNLVLFDLATLQVDRFRRNIEYLLVDNGESFDVELAPIFDNSLILYSEDLFKYVQLSVSANSNRPVSEEFVKNKLFGLGLNEKFKFDDLVKQLRVLKLTSFSMRKTIEKLKNLDYEQVYQEIIANNKNFNFPKNLVYMVKSVSDRLLKSLENEKMFTN